MSYFLKAMQTLSANQAKQTTERIVSQRLLSEAQNAQSAIAILDVFDADDISEALDVRSAIERDNAKHGGE